MIKIPNPIKYATLFTILLETFSKMTNCCSYTNVHENQHNNMNNNLEPINHNALWLENLNRFWRDVAIFLTAFGLGYYLRGLLYK